jgi:Rps23 Pro-64 3,4-dihydroxylase Tpa1-like proline 4-hydroxylase
VWTLGPAWSDERALAAAWRAAVPFPHLVFDDFESSVLGLVEDIGVEHQQGDLFSFDASADLPEVSASFGAVLAPPLARITGKPVTRAELRAYSYWQGHYLLPHSDHQDGLERLLAFAYYLPSPEPPEGGELELFRCTVERGEIVATDSALLIEPRANRLVVFDVGDISLHQVREVLGGLRLSLAGWFYP